jgi:uncharacterized membrane protein
MSTRRIAIYSAICLTLLLFLIPLYQADCQNYVAYSIQINIDGSALWKITNFSDVNASIDTFGSFQDKVINLIASSANVTHRDMTVDEGSLQINTTISSQSKTTEYMFLWQNFSIVQENQIIFGDVFGVNSFFNKLYGDDALKISYPLTFTVESVIPAPYQRDDSAKTLDWARTQDLVNAKSNIILSRAMSNDNSSQNEWQLYIIIVVVGATLGLVSFYLLKQRKIKQAKTIVVPKESVEMETEEGKILKLLQSSGGSMRQSVIVEQCRFSKAKTSQLLTVLEKDGYITRYKKGRDKIVNLTEQRVKAKKE